VARNAPTLLNVGFQKAFFLDASTTYLEDQVVVVNQNVNEMHGNFAQLANKLNGSLDYQQLFKAAFKGTSDTTISKDGIVKAIASFERTLISMNSKFDKYMRNESVSLTSSEKNGFNLFMGKAQCGTCHFAPFFNGTVPPNFDKSEWEIIGVPANANNKKLDPDLGRYQVAKMDIHQYAFKTTTVRNVEYTAPYMHNGVYKDLNQVLDFYNKGGGIGHGYEVPNQTLPSDSLNLSSSEMNDIIAFMNTLSDTVGLTQKPNQLPLVLMNGKELKRKIGGEY
jgi:cytochrome c peroxidase